MVITCEPSPKQTNPHFISYNIDVETGALEAREPTNLLKGRGSSPNSPNSLHVNIS